MSKYFIKYTTYQGYLALPEESLTARISRNI